MTHIFNTEPLTVLKEMAITHLRPIAATVLNFEQRLTPIPNDGVNLYLVLTDQYGRRADVFRTRI